MLKFESYIEMTKTNMTEVKEFTFDGDTYNFISHTPPPPMNFTDKHYNGLSNDGAQKLNEFIALDNARYTGTIITFHCYETEHALYLYCEDGFIKNFLEVNEFELAQ